MRVKERPSSEVAEKVLDDAPCCCSFERNEGQVVVILTDVIPCAPGPYHFV